MMSHVEIVRYVADGSESGRIIDAMDLSQQAWIAESAGFLLELPRDDAPPLWTVTEKGLALLKEDDDDRVEVRPLDDFPYEERLDVIKSHLSGPTTSPLFLLDACRWLVGKVERLDEVCSIAVGQIDELENETMPIQQQTITLTRRGQRGKPGHEEYRVEKLHNRREPIVGSDLTPEHVDRLIRHAGRPHQGAILNVTILASK